LSEYEDNLDWETEFAYEELSKPELEKFLRSLQLYYRRQLKTEEQLRVFEDNLQTYTDSLKEILKSRKVGYYDKDDVEVVKQVYDILRFYRDSSDSYHEELEEALELTKQYLEKIGYENLDRIPEVQLSLDNKQGMYQKARQDALQEMTQKLVNREYHQMKEGARKDLLLELVSGKPAPKTDYRTFDEKFAEGLEGAVKDIKEELKYRKLLQGASTDPNYRKDMGTNPEYQLKIEQLALDSEQRRKGAVDKFLQAWKEEKQREEELYQRYKKQRNL